MSESATERVLYDVPKAAERLGTGDERWVSHGRIMPDGWDASAARTLPCDEEDARVHVWVEELVIHADVSEKLLRKHGLAADVVRRAVLYQLGLEGRWHDHVDYGRRLLVMTTHPDDGTELFVVLAPIDERMGSWVCKTAMRPT